MLKENFKLGELFNMIVSFTGIVIIVLS